MPGKEGRKKSIGIRGYKCQERASAKGEEIAGDNKCQEKSSNTAKRLAGEGERVTGESKQQ